MMNSLFGIISTLFSYKIAKFLNKYPIIKEISPILSAGLIIILFLKVFKIDYETYKKGANCITFFLIPATIALGYPLYKNVSMLVKNKRVVYFAFLLASLVAFLSTFLIGNFGNSEKQIVLSMLPKSITAPMALEASKLLGGIPELTACVVVLTGIFGGIFGHKILNFVKVKNHVAIGIAMGAASHVIGTSKCIEKGNQKQIVMSTLALVVVGIITVALSPILSWVLELIKFS